MATVELTREAQKAALALPGPIKVRVLKVIDRLRAWPNVSGAKPLLRSLAGSYRIRTGDYRVVFHVVKTTVVITHIAIRRDVYDE